MFSSKFRLLAAAVALFTHVFSPLHAQSNSGPSSGPLKSGEPAQTAALPSIETIVVTADRIPTPLVNIGSSISVIGSQQIESEQKNLVFDVLREIPGVTVTSTGGIGQPTEVRVRGFDPQNVKVLIDGIEVADPAQPATAFDFANLLTDNIARIEVLRGPQSTLFGSDAMGGVINIITKTGTDDPGALVTGEGGSYGTERGSGTVRGTYGRLDYSASISGLHSDGFSVADRPPGNFQNAGYDNISSNLNLKYRFDDQADLNAVFRSVDSRDHYASFGASGLPYDDPGLRNVVAQRFGRIAGHLFLFDGRLDNTLGYSVAETDRDDLNFSTVSNYFRGRLEKIDYQGSWRFDFPATLVFGAEDRIEHYDDNTGFTAQQSTVGGYSDLSWQPLEALSVTAGVRYDDTDRYGPATTDRFVFAYTIAETDTKLKASYGTGFRSPSLYQAFVSAPYVIGNPNLKPELSEGVDVGFTQSIADDRLVFDVTYYHNDVEQLINFTTLPSGIGTYQNIAKARTYGVETETKTRPYQWLETTLSYTWARAIDATTGQELPRRPHHEASLTLTAELSDEAEIFAQARYIGAQQDLDFQPGHGPLTKLTPYQLYNFGGSYQLTELVNLYGRVENITDRRYEEVLGYGEAGRAGYAGVKVRF